MADQPGLSALSAPTWWAGLPAVDNEIACRDQRHRLRWSEGILTAPDHRGAGRRPPVRKGDPPRRPDEEVPVAVDGCDAVIRAWRALRTDPRSLVLGQRHPGDTLEGGVLLGGERQDERIAADPMAHLLALVGPALGRRLQAEAAVALGEVVAGDPHDDRAAMLLEAATVGRVGPVLDRWLGPGHRARVALGDRSGVTAGDRPLITLAPGWLGSVWGRYLNVVDGFLLLEIVRIVDDRAEVVGVSRPGGEQAMLTLVGPAPWRARGRRTL